VPGPAGHLQSYRLTAVAVPQQDRRAGLADGMLVAPLHQRHQHAAQPGGPAMLLTHRDCGQPVRLELTCGAGHVLGSAREVTPRPGPGARRIA